MQYTKKKDKCPIETVETIKSILKGIEIDSLSEMVLSRVLNEHCCESLRLFLPDDYFTGTNGKGTDINYAKASAYGEFIERIQLPLILKYKPVDALDIRVSEFFKRNLQKYFLPQNKLKNKKYLKKIEKISTNFSDSFFNKKIEVIPYYHVNSKEIVYLPHNLKWYTSISTGSSAGNTNYEALIEGICEICERYVQTKAICESISFPDIPTDEYMKFDSIRKIAEYIEKIGLKLEVKDASLNGKFPVVCTILKTLDDKSYYACFGSHPSLPIAIERCLTETMQGIDFSDKKVVDFIFVSHNKKENDLLFAKYDNSLWHRYIELNKNFFISEPEYVFRPENWACKENLSNEEIFENLINKLLSFDIDVFIRDANYLDFPTYQVYIPQLMSHYFLVDDEKGEDLKFNNYKCDKYFKHEIETKITKQELLDFFNYIFHLKTKYSHNDYKNLELYFVLLLINFKETDRALKILLEMKNKKMFYSKRRIISFLIDYLQNRKALKNNYSKFTVNYMFKFYLCNSAYKNIIVALRNRKTVTSIAKSEGKTKKKEIISALLSKYKANCPNQLELSTLFN